MINEETTKKQPTMFIDIRRVNNGFIVDLDRDHNRMISFSENTFVFNTLDQLAEFIKNLDND